MMILRIFGCQLVVVLAIVFSAACSSGAKDASQRDLKADAGVDITVLEGETITLDASNSSSSQGVSYEWRQISGSLQLIVGSVNNVTFDIEAPSVNDNTVWIFELTVRYGSGTAKDNIQVTVIPVNYAPTASAVSITGDNEGNAKIGDSLIGHYTYTDAETDDEGTSTFRWLRNGEAITGATNKSYTLVLDDVPTQITFEVTPVAITGQITGSAVTSVVINAGKALNDTGITSCGDYAYGATTPIHNNDLVCSSQPTPPTRDSDGVDDDDNIVPGGQDALYGRDDTHNDDSDGHAGFSFTKLNSNGDPLTNQAQEYGTRNWYCVKDNVTGLIWEVKTTSGLQSSAYLYTWYNKTGIINNNNTDIIYDGGDYGIGDTGSSTTTGYESDPITEYNGSDKCEYSDSCDTEKYVEDVNALDICGEVDNDWRLPSKHELLSIVNDYNVDPNIDVNYFPNTQPGFYWSSTPLAELNHSAWVVHFGFDLVRADRKNYPKYVRLVRGRQ